MEIHNPVLDSAKFIAENASHVRIPSVSKAADFIAKRYTEIEYSVKEWKKHPLNPSIANENAIEW
jgi:hypothetical protein